MLDRSAAVVSRVPSPYGGRVLTRSTALAKNGLFLFQVLVILAVSFVPAVLSVAIANRVSANNRDLSFLPILVGLGITGLLLWLFIGQLLRNPWSSRYIYNKTLDEFQYRPDSIVDLTEPDAILIEVVPRRNWGKFTLDNAEDQGFLCVDQERRQLLFEGDKNRYRIPVEAVLSCEVEVMNPSESRSTPIACVVLTFRDERIGEREAPLLPRRTIGGADLGANYVERSNELYRRLQSLLAEPSLLATATPAANSDNISHAFVFPKSNHG
jgi:hypothetical protein